MDGVLYCSETSLVKNEGPTGTAVTLRCRTWSHPPCAEIRRRQLKDLALAGEPTSFLTLTSRRKPGLTATRSANQLRDAWQIVYREIVRQHGKDKVSCLSVFEKTKTGWPHLHILCRMPYVPQAWLSRRMRELIDSPVVDIRALSSVRKAAAYVAKYIAKDPHRFEGCKRYWRSQDWVLDPIDDDTPVMDRGKGWEPDQRSITALEYELRVQRYLITWDGDTLVFVWAYPTDPPFQLQPLRRPP